MSNRIHRSRIPTIALVNLPALAKAALIDAKNRLRSGENFPEFRNEDDTRGGGAPLPKLSAGCHYIEIRVGAARPGDDQPVGRYRLVGEFHATSRRMREVYYTEDHYEKFTFQRVL